MEKLWFVSEIFLFTIDTFILNSVSNKTQPDPEELGTQFSWDFFREICQLKINIAVVIGRLRLNLGPI